MMTKAIKHGHDPVKATAAVALESEAAILIARLCAMHDGMSVAAYLERLVLEDARRIGLGPLARAALDLRGAGLIS